MDEPQPDLSIPPAPEHLSPDARAEWDRITDELHQLGLMTNLDMAALAIYCTAYGRYAEAERHLREEGILKQKDANADPYHNAWMGVSNRAIELMKSMLAEFGLSPSARTRIKVKPAKPEGKERFFA